MNAFPREARDGLMRAWLKVLSERHPDVTWVPAQHMDDTSEEKGGETKYLLLKEPVAS